MLQYDGYVSHVQEDTKDPAATSKTPTLGSTEIFVRDLTGTRWEGVPIVILGGKGLDERRAYVSVQFRAPPGEDKQHYELLFHIQGGVPKRGPYIAVGKGLPAIDAQSLSVGGDAAVAVERAIQAEDVPWVRPSIVVLPFFCSSFVLSFFLSFCFVFGRFLSFSLSLSLSRSLSRARSLSFSLSLSLR